MTDDRSTPWVEGSPVGPAYHEGREDHPDRLCPYCRAIGVAPCVVTRPRAVSIDGSGVLVVPRGTEAGR